MMLSGKRALTITCHLAIPLMLAGCMDFMKDQVVEIAETDGTDVADGGSTGNRPPIIFGAPGNAVKADEPYRFTPSVGDPENDPLTFSIVNEPGWASFDRSRGTLSGTPRAEDVGMYSNIVISVSDGVNYVSMPMFSLDVTQSAPGSITLSWTAPTQNTDGSTLTDLAAYRIYFGRNEGYYPSQILLDNPGLTTYVIENLSPSNYYFVATSINSIGIESEYSNVTSRTVN